MASKPRLAIDNTAGSRKNESKDGRRSGRPTPAQLGWLRRGLDQAGGKLPLFDGNGQRVKERTIRACIGQGWAEPWFDNPIKPDWLICKLTESGRRIVQGGGAGN